MGEQHEVVIVGGGIAGLATALGLTRVGIKCLVLESYHGMRSTGAALTLFPNAWRALDALGVAHKLTPFYNDFHIGRVTNISSGATQEVSYKASKDSGVTGVRTVHRKALLEALADELPMDTIRFSSKLDSIKTEVLPNSSVVNVLHLDDGTVIKAKVLIGCDGVHSVVAQWLGLSEPVDSGRSAVRGIAEFREGHGLKKEPQQFLSPGKRAGIIPINEHDVYWFITSVSTPQERAIARDPELIQREVTEKLAKDFPEEYLNVVRHADLSTVSWAPLMYRRPWDLILGPTHKGSVALAGDALHPMTPDLGQGGCSALEDAVVLARCIAVARTPAEGIDRYVGERRWRVAGLIAGAYLSGWAQQPRSGGIWGWAARWFRDHIFYRIVYPLILNAVNYDCGDLPHPK